MMSCHTHARLLRVQSKVLPDDLLAGGHGDLDGAVHYGVDELLHSPLNGLSHTLLQLRVGLEQGDLQGEKSLSTTTSPNTMCRSKPRYLSESATYVDVDIDVRG